MDSGSQAHVNGCLHGCPVVPQRMAPACWIVFSGRRGSLQGFRNPWLLPSVIRNSPLTVFVNLRFLIRPESTRSLRLAVICDSSWVCGLPTDPVPGHLSPPWLRSPVSSGSLCRHLLCCRLPAPPKPPPSLARLRVASLPFSRYRAADRVEEEPCLRIVHPPTRWLTCSVPLWNVAPAL